MAAFRAAWDMLGARQDRFHDCPHCDGKANIPVHGRPAYKCTRCGKVTAEAELRRLSMRRNPIEDD
jgi:ribosomal protein L37AE/L43A